MDAGEDRGAPDPRVAEIRAEIEAVRLRIAEAIDALGYKADVGARLGDVVSSTAATLTTRVLQRVPTMPRRSPDPDEAPEVDDVAERPEERDSTVVA
jgi:hypothetical protein